MKYSYTFKLNRQDMWKYYMSDRYSSLAGVAQIIFVVSISLLVFTKWDELGVIMRILTLIGLSLFTVVQPLAFMVKADKAIDCNMPFTTISFGEDTMEIKVQHHIQTIKYGNIVQVIKKPALLLIQPDQKHLYILTNRILGSEKKELYEYLKTKII